MRGGSRGVAPFSIILDRVAVIHEAVERVITFIQDFVPEPIPLFTQKKFFWQRRGKVKDAVAVADSVIVSEELNPWSLFVYGCNQQVVSDLQSCQEKVVLRHKVSRGASKRWLGAPSAGLPSASASVGRSGVRLWNFMEEGQVEYVAVPEPYVNSLRSVKSPVFGSKRKPSTLSGQLSRKNFELVGPVTSPRKSYRDDPNFGAALAHEASGSYRRSGRDIGAPPISNFPKKK